MLLLELDPSNAGLLDAVRQASEAYESRVV